MTSTGPLPTALRPRPLTRPAVAALLALAATVALAGAPSADAFTRPPAAPYCDEPSGRELAAQGQPCMSYQAVVDVHPGRSYSQVVLRSTFRRGERPRHRSYRQRLTVEYSPALVEGALAYYRVLVPVLDLGRSRDRLIYERREVVDDATGRVVRRTFTAGQPGGMAIFRSWSRREARVHVQGRQGGARVIVGVLGDDAGAYAEPLTLSEVSSVSQGESVETTTTPTRRPHLTRDRYQRATVASFELRARDYAPGSWHRLRVVAPWRVTVPSGVTVSPWLAWQPEPSLGVSYARIFTGEWSGVEASGEVVTTLLVRRAVGSRLRVLVSHRTP